MLWSDASDLCRDPHWVKRIPVAMRDALTLDSNITIEYWKNQLRRSVVEKLLALARTGEVSLMVTARIREDIPQEPLARELDRLPELGVVEGPSVARLGFWVLGRDMLGSNGFVAVSSEIEAEFRRTGRNPPDWRDFDHLHAHMLQGRDVYLTWDRRVLDAADMLRVRFSLRVSSPEQYLDSRPSSRPRSSDSVA